MGRGRGERGGGKESATGRWGPQCLLPLPWLRSEFPSSPAAVGSACLMDHTPSELYWARVSGRQDSVFHGSLIGKKMSLRVEGRESSPWDEVPTSG